MPYPLTRVTIVGLGGTSREFVKLQANNPLRRSPTEQIWTINGGSNAFVHDVAWDMHDFRHERWKKLPEKYTTLEGPLVTARYTDAVKDCWEYPLAEVIDAFGMDYFANGAAYLIAFALLCGVKRIDLFGLDYDYVGKGEYETGRCNIEFWCGFAAGRGVQIASPPNSTLLDNPYRLPGGKGRNDGGRFYGYYDSEIEIGVNGDGKVIFEGFLDDDAD